MCCLRDFDMVAAYKEPNLFRLYGEIPYGIEQGFILEEQVKRHIKNSNYGHQGDSKSADFYKWEDLSDVLEEFGRFEHDMTHTFLGILCHEEGVDPFLADGNLIAEAFVHAFEGRFKFWNDRYEDLINVYEQNVYSAMVETYCYEDRPYALTSLRKALSAASDSERPMTAFEARFLGVMPESNDYRKMSIGEVNKWGEALPDLEPDLDLAKLFFRRMEVVRKRMFETLDATPFGTDNKEVCQIFFKTLKMDELAEIISGRNPHQKLSFNYGRVKSAYMCSYNPAEMMPFSSPNPAA